MFLQRVDGMLEPRGGEQFLVAVEQRERHPHQAQRDLDTIGLWLFEEVRRGIGAWAGRQQVLVTKRTE